MSQELIINVTSQEVRVALLENGILAELYIERARDRSIVGNIYKGKTIKVVPGMQAAFVDIGLDKAAFLYVSEYLDSFEEFEFRMEGGEEDVEFEPSERSRETQRTSLNIGDLLKEGQEILVQVEREPIGTKGARLTSHITLPGRYLVFMPTFDHVGVSRRIENPAERKRLREIVMSMKPPNAGFIVRTAAEGAGEEELRADMIFLGMLWNNIQKKKDQVSAPHLIHQDLDLILRSVRDLFTSQVERLVIDDRQAYMRIMEFVETFMPNMKHAVELYEKDEPIFDYYGIEVEIARAMGKKVWLKSGGYIVIEETEALTAIDVNTGRYLGKRNLEDTILKTNLEAVKEIVYQLRLRNIGGIIIIDFIDMEKESSREKVFNALKEALKKDKTKTNVLRISELGLVEMTRKRVRESLLKTLTEPCPHCEGTGFVKSRVTVCYEIFREIKREMPRLRGKKIVVHAHPTVADLLYDEERHGIEELEKRLGKRIAIKAKPELDPEQFEILSI